MQYISSAHATATLSAKWKRRVGGYVVFVNVMWYLPTHSQIATIAHMKLYLRACDGAVSRVDNFERLKLDYSMWDALYSKVQLSFMQIWMHQEIPDRNNDLTFLVSIASD